MIVKFRYKGSSSSGNRMHAGRPGKVGGSAPKSFAYPTSANPTDLEPKDIVIAGKTGAEWMRTSADLSARKEAILRDALAHEKPDLDKDATDKYIDRLNAHRAGVMEETLRVSQHYDLTAEEQAQLMKETTEHDTLDKYGVRTAVPYIDKIAHGVQKGSESKDFWKVCNEHHDNNPHHPEYWSAGEDRAPQMPTINLIQMAGDWIATAKFFNTPKDGYYRKYGGTEFTLHPNTRAAAERELGIKETPFPWLFPRDFFGAQPSKPATQPVSRHEDRGKYRQPEQGKLPGLDDANAFLQRMHNQYSKEYKPGKLPKFGIDAVLLAPDEVDAKEVLIIRFGVKGSAKSGNYGHAGIPGHRGGSQKKSTAPIAAVVEPKVELKYQPSANAVKQATAYANEQIQMMAKKERVSKEQFEKDCLTKLTEAAQRPLCVRVSHVAAENILQDGRFKTQFETKTSIDYDPAFRAGAENNGLGIPLKVDPKERPVYGYLKTAGDSTSAYGIYEYVMKDNVKARTTMTAGDSLSSFDFGEMVGAPVNKPSIACMGNMADVVRSGNMRSMGYYEAQIQGGVNLADVAKVVIHTFGSKYDASRDKAIGDKYAQAGIKVEYDSTTP